MNNQSINYGMQATSILNAANFMNQMIPVTEFKRNFANIIERLADNHSLYIMKNSKIMAVLVEQDVLTEMFNKISEQQDYIERLENDVAIMSSKIDSKRISHDVVSAKLQAALEAKRK